MANTPNNNPAAVTNHNSITEPATPVIVKVDETAELNAIKLHLSEIKEIVDALESGLFTSKIVRSSLYTGLNNVLTTAGARANRLAKNPAK